MIVSDIELRITEKMDFILVERSVGMKQNEKADKSSEAVKKSLRGELGSAVKMYSQCCGTRTVKKPSCVLHLHIQSRTNTQEVPWTGSFIAKVPFLM